MDLDRKQILTSCLDVIAGVSDKEYQKRVWIRGDGPEFDDFDETVCNFFQEGDAILEEYTYFGITEVQYKVLKDFRDLFDQFVITSRQYLPVEFIETPEWEKVIEKAKVVLQVFNYKKR